MSAKSIFFFLFIVGLVGTLALLAMGATPASAQCAEPQPSSCTTCHAHEDPVNEKGEWHIIHASQDICKNCHGGNGSTMDKDLAHEGLVAQPLSDIYTDCHSCHPDYTERAAKYAATLQITPSSCATSTPVVVGNISNGPPPGNIITQAGLMSASPPLQYFLLIGGGMAFLTLFILGLGWLDRHHV